MVSKDFISSQEEKKNVSVTGDARVTREEMRGDLLRRGFVRGE